MHTITPPTSVPTTIAGQRRTGSSTRHMTASGSTTSTPDDALASTAPPRTSPSVPPSRASPTAVVSGSREDRRTRVAAVAVASITAASS